MRKDYNNITIEVIEEWGEELLREWEEWKQEYFLILYPLEARLPYDKIFNKEN